MELHGSESKRVYWIDALKFIAMIVVFISHLRLAFFPGLPSYFEIGKFKIPNYFIAGKLAVSLFLFISVFLFAQKALNKEYELKDALITIRNRYLRLFCPALIVNLLIIVLYIFGLFYNEKIPSDLQNVHEWFAFGSNLKAIVSGIRDSLSLCFFTTWVNPPLWCYNLLFLFPAVAFLIILYPYKIVGGGYKTLIFLIIFALLGILNFSYITIIPLVFISMLSKKMFKKHTILIINVLLLLVVVFCQVILLSYNMNYLKFREVLFMVMASCIFNLFYNFEHINFLNFKLFSVLNKISFGVYLLHMPVICSLGFALYLKGISIRIIIIAVSVCLTAVSIIFHILCEKKFTNFIIKKVSK